MLSRLSFLLSVLCFLNFYGQASAQEELYDAPPPEDAAFVRFLGTDATSASFSGLTFEADENDLSDWFVVHADDVGLSVGDFVSVLPDGTPMVEPAKSVEKITLGLVNLTASPVELKTADGSVAIIESVAAQKAGWREVNPITVEVQVFGPDAIGAPIPLALRRDEHHTIVVGSDGSIADVVSDLLPGVVE